MIYSEWLAKNDPPETLIDHTANCVRTAMRLLDLLPSVDTVLREQLVLAAATHDLGKAAIGFQRVLRGDAADWRGCRHEALSAVLSAWFPQVSEAVVLSVLLHHRTLPCDGVCDDKGTFYAEQLPPPLARSPAWQKMARELDEAVLQFPSFWQELAVRIPEANLPVWPEIVGNWREAPGLQSIDRRWVDRGQQLEISSDARCRAARLRGLLRTADHLASAREWPPDAVEWKSLALPHVPKLRGFQTTASHIAGDIMMQAPTGSGKTEACLLWLKRNGSENARMFYVLPFTASINAMHHRLDRLFPGKVGVLHGKAVHYLNRWLGETEGPQTVADRRRIQGRARGMKQVAREMYFPLRVCTPHQLMRYLLRGPGWEQMLSEFRGACFVFDEVHAYDPRMVGLILGGMKLAREMGGHVAYVSATLPRFLRRLIEDHVGVANFIAPDPREASDREILSRRRHLVRVHDASLLDVIDDIRNDLNQGPTLVVANHVRSAQSFYAKAADLFGLSPDDMVLLHGSFNGRDRARIEKRILADNPPRLLIATQAVEVSLDISYSCGYFEVAPIDALIQRMGRVNRSGTARQPAIINIMSKQLSAHALYDPTIVKATLDALVPLQDSLSEGRLAELADQVYGDGYDEKQSQAFMDAFHHPDYDGFAGRMLAGAHQDWVENVVERADRTVEVLPLCLRTEYDNLVAQGLWLDAAGLLVAIRVGRLAQMRGSLFTSEDPWQVRLPYSPETGLCYESIVDVESQLI